MSIHEQSTVHPVYDLKRLLNLHENIETLNPTDPPSVRLLTPCPSDSPVRLCGPSGSAGVSGRVGILCGSFNPLTRAHTELAEQISKAWQLDRVFLSLAKVTVDKVQISGMALEDRLLLLSLYAERHPDISICLVNRGLYVEQAQAFRVLCGAHVPLFFLTGMDKLTQILDVRYYQDRDAALHELFRLAGLIVANRGTFSRKEFTHLLDRRENQAFRPAIHFFQLTDATPSIDSTSDSPNVSHAPSRPLKDLSATTIREALVNTRGAGIGEYVPPETAQFVSETQVYHRRQPQSEEVIDPYSVRVALIELLYSVRSWAEHAVDFRRLLQRAVADDATGRTLRNARSTMPQHEIIALLSSCLD